MVKALDLLTEDEVLQQGRTSVTSAETVLILNWTANIGGHEGVVVVQVELRQELLRLGSGTTTTLSTTVDSMRVLGEGARQLACHVRTGSTSNADDAWQKSNCAHLASPGGILEPEAARNGQEDKQVKAEL